MIIRINIRVNNLNTPNPYKLNPIATVPQAWVLAIIPQPNKCRSSMMAKENPYCSPLTHKIASCGSHGRHPQNIERDLYRALQLPLDTWMKRIN